MSILKVGSSLEYGKLWNSGNKDHIFHTPGYSPL